MKLYGRVSLVILLAVFLAGGIFASPAFGQEFKPKNCLFGGLKAHDLEDQKAQEIYGFTCIGVEGGFFRDFSPEFRGSVSVSIMGKDQLPSYKENNHKFHISFIHLKICGMYVWNRGKPNLYSGGGLVYISIKESSETGMNDWDDNYVESFSTSSTGFVIIPFGVDLAVSDRVGLIGEINYTFSTAKSAIGRDVKVGGLALGACLRFQIGK